MKAKNQYFQFLLLLVTPFIILNCNPPEKIILVADQDLGPTGLYAVERLEAKLIQSGYQVETTNPTESRNESNVVYLGTAKSRWLSNLKLGEIPYTLAEEPESLVIHKFKEEGEEQLLLLGQDEKGLMYAALEAAEKIGWNQPGDAVFGNLENKSESPDLAERSVSIFTMQRKYWESRLYDQAYWEKYFDLLAESRINSFVVIFGYENGGFLAPAYPYFFDLEDFPGVKMIGITPEEQAKNTAAFKQMIRLAHERGIAFKPGIWDHIYRAGVQSGGIRGKEDAPEEPEEGLVWGLNADNLGAYTKAALAKFLQTFPEIDGIQFRMHWESGLSREETPGFWRQVFTFLEDKYPAVQLDIRAKGLPDVVIQSAIDKGLDFRIATKYWMEQMGLPFHPTHVNRGNQHDRRHGYADLLTYPQNYKIHWRLWNGGTNRILLWGDPEYVQRFMESTTVYDGNSFEINEPLATKMEAQPHDMEPFELLNPEHQYYEYEFERYWYFFNLWGLTGYNQKIRPAFWQQKFAHRFGEDTGMQLYKAMEEAGDILPMIVAATYRYRWFPMTRGWAEKMRMDDLPDFADAQGSDIQQFADFSEAANLQLSGKPAVKQLPEATAQWFTRTSQQILEIINQLPATDNKEINSFISDLKIQAWIAAYYGERIPAAVFYNIYLENHDPISLARAIKQENKAIEAWSQLVNAAGDVYTDNIRMGICHGNMCGHWRDELEMLQKGLLALKSEQDSVMASLQKGQPSIYHTPGFKFKPGQKIKLKAAAGGEQAPKDLKVFIMQGDGGFEEHIMQPAEDRSYQLEFELPAQNQEVRYYFQASSDNGNQFNLPAENVKSPFTILVSNDWQPPAVDLSEPGPAIPGQPLVIKAEVKDENELEKVNLRYRHLTQFEDYLTVAMQFNPESGLYEGEIPGDFIVPEWDLMYFIEVLDSEGNGKMYPDFQVEMPYVIIKPERNQNLQVSK